MSESQQWGLMFGVLLGFYVLECYWNHRLQTRMTDRLDLLGQRLDLLGVASGVPAERYRAASRNHGQPVDHLEGL